MSDLLTHWAVFDDCRRLLQHDQKAEPFLNQILREKAEYARLGSLARGGSRFVPHILRNAKTSDLNERWQQKIAFALGGILHFPADHIFKPMMSALMNTDWETMQRGAQFSVSKREVSAYFDCHVFKKVYLAGHEEPFSRFLVAENTTTPGIALEEFVRALFQRALLSSHTLAPNFNDLDGWLDNLCDQVQPLYIDIALYVRVFQHPESGKIEAFKVETEFYRDADPLIQQARCIHRGETVSQTQFDSALDSGENFSGYARALQMGVRKMREAGAFWRGEQSEAPSVEQ